MEKNELLLSVTITATYLAMPESEFRLITAPVLNCLDSLQGSFSGSPCSKYFGLVTDKNDRYEQGSCKVDAVLRFYPSTPQTKFVNELCQLVCDYLPTLLDHRCLMYFQMNKIS